jgi:hypothetical protein
VRRCDCMRSTVSGNRLERRGKSGAMASKLSYTCMPVSGHTHSYTDWSSVGRVHALLFHISVQAQGTCMLCVLCPGSHRAEVCAMRSRRRSGSSGQAVSVRCTFLQIRGLPLSCLIELGFEADTSHLLHPTHRASIYHSTSLLKN